MANPCHLLIFFITLFHSLHYSAQLPSSQYQAMLKIKQQLNFPQQLTETETTLDFCNIEPSPILTVSCYEDNITQLHLTGNSFFPKLSQDFSMSALFSTLSSLPNLKVLTLVSLGLKGPLPSLIGNLTSLEILNISSNALNGSIPFEVKSLRNLQTLIMDNNVFTGSIPDWIGEFPGLSVLSFRNNSFSGFFPNVLSNMSSLRTLVLSENRLSGEVNGLDYLTNLQVLDLGNNNLGPRFPVLPKKLVSLVLRNNSFHSVVSDELSSCYQLQQLDVSSNQLVGAFSPSVFALPSLNYLDISRNKLTGKLSKNMSCNDNLVVVNLTENRFTGDLPDCLRRSRVVLYNGNCLDRRYHRNQNPYAFCHSEALAVTISPKEKVKRPNGRVVLASSMVGGVVGAFAIFWLAFVFVKKEVCRDYYDSKVPKTKLIVDKVSGPGNTLKLLQDARYISDTMKLGSHGIPAYRTFVVHEVKEATNNFHESNCLGDGSNGQVHKGRLTDGTTVAVRSLKVKKKQNIQVYTHQIELFSKLRHCHLASAIGHSFDCFEDDFTINQIFLIFEYVPNGSLRRFISEGQPGERFSWTQRIGAAIGVAKGIQFLHTGIVPGVCSNNLKITDILLDHDHHVKISKYNIPLLVESRRLAEVGTSSQGSKENAGSTSSIGMKNDVYDIGVILLELLVGRQITSKNDILVSNDILLESLAADEVAQRNVVDPMIQKECSDASLKTIIELCIRCLSNEPSERPTVEDVIWNLQFAAQVQDSWLLDSNSRENSPVHVPITID